jgi:Asp/Glu/hydantoin racemase
MALRAEEIGLGAHCVCVLATEGDPAAMMATPAELESALQALAERAVVEHGAEAIVIGGGPLGRVAKALSGKSAYRDRGDPGRSVPSRRCLVQQLLVEALPG